MAPASPPKTSTALLVKLLRRVILDCTQSDLSTRSGVHENLLSRYESGEVKPTSRNLDRLLNAAGVLGIKEPLCFAVDHLFDLLNPPPQAAATPGDPLLLEDLLRRTALRLRQLQPDPQLLPGEYIPPTRREFHSTALLVRFLRNILLDCTLLELSSRSGIDKDLISRYGRGKIQPGPAKLDRLLAEAHVLHLKEPLLRAMDHLSAVLSREPQPAKTTDDEPLLAPSPSDSLLAFADELLRRTTAKFFPDPVPEG
ncbi:MAG TPA: helix-turn-helix transcriptional regulator [Thermoanaerobaculia bacterium]|nr:helix-turn-helix transcriptional regulator [Thermoanaerobaculia bacterium]